MAARARSARMEGAVDDDAWRAAAPPVPTDAADLPPEDYEQSPAFFADNQRHVFAVTFAGKPIYSRHGEEHKLASFMGMIAGLVCQFDDMGDGLRCIEAGGCKIVFTAKDPVYLVAVMRGAPLQCVSRQLDFVYLQLVSLLTSTRINVLNKNPNYDLRGMMGGTEHVMDRLCDEMELSPCFLLQGFACVALDQATRSAVTELMLAARHEAMLFGMLLSGSRVMAMCQGRKSPIDPRDMLLLINFVQAHAQAFRSSENWTPVCLPIFAEQGFLYAYVHFVLPDLCYVFVSNQNDVFFEFSAAQKALAASLQAPKGGGLMAKMAAAVERPAYPVSALGYPDLWHFMFKMHSLGQLTYPAFGDMYEAEPSRRRLFRAYQRIHAQVHAGASGERRDNLACFFGGAHESILVWLNADFEFFATFSPLVEKTAAMSICTYLVNTWLHKERGKLFLIGRSLGEW